MKRKIAFAVLAAIFALGAWGLWAAKALWLPLALHSLNCLSPESARKAINESDLAGKKYILAQTGIDESGEVFLLMVKDENGLPAHEYIEIFGETYRELIPVSGFYAAGNTFAFYIDPEEERSQVSYAGRIMSNYRASGWDILYPVAHASILANIFGAKDCIADTDIALGVERWWLQFKRIMGLIGIDPEEEIKKLGLCYSEKYKVTRCKWIDK